MEPPRKIPTEMSTLEDRLAAVHAALAAAPSKSALSDAHYAELRSLMLTHPIVRAVQRVFDAGLRNLSDERAPSAVTAEATELARAEQKLAWMRAVLTIAPSKAGLPDAAYLDLRAFMLEFPLVRVFRSVLDAATRNLADERRDAGEFALAINIA